MKSNKIVKRAIMILAVVLVMAVFAIEAIMLGGTETSGHAALISGSGLDRIEVLDKDGDSVWKLPQTEIGWQEVNDADMLPNGNVVFACRTASGSTVYMIKPDYKKGSGFETLWTYQVPAGAENHTSQVLPNGRILIGEAYASYVRIVELDAQGNVCKTLGGADAPLQGWPGGSNSHSQVRQIYKTEEGTYLLASMSTAKTIEYSSDGIKLAEYGAGGFTAVTDNNGNVIVAGGDSHSITCFDREDGSILWKIGQKDIKGISLGFVAAIDVLDNGNIVFANWGGHGGASGDAVIEITVPTADKEAEIVWGIDSGSPTSNVCIVDDIGSSVLRGEIESAPYYQGSAEYRSPIDAVGSVMTDQLYVADETNNTIEVINVVNDVIVNEFEVSQKPNALLLSPDAKYLYVATGASNGKVEVINVATGLKACEAMVGHTPSALAISDNGDTLYVANRFNGTIQSIALIDGEIVDGTEPTIGVYVTREPMSLALRDDKLYVGGHLPEGAVNDGSVSCEVVCVDLDEMKVDKVITMVSGSTNLKDIALSPDGEYLYVSHALGRWNVATTHVDRGWIYTNAVTEIRTADNMVMATMLVDDLDLGAANPWGIDVSDGLIVLSISGTRELMILDRVGLRQKIEDVHSGKIGGNGYLEAPEDIALDLAFTTKFKQRIYLGEDGPRGIELMGNKIYTTNYYSGSISVYDIKAQRLGKISLETSKEEDATRAGERLWNDATICMGQWQSCASCHPDGRADGLNWDNMNDGIGTPKQTRSMVGSWGRGRVMATGIRPDTMTANRAGLKYICFNGGFPESEFVKIDAYTQNIKAEDSPYLVNGQLSESALRGKELFEGEANCASCHSSANFGADVLIYENFTMSETESRGLLVPPLVEAWRTAPYLHDGSASTILDVITTRNLTGTHGNVSDLSDDQLLDLCNYVLSIGGSIMGEGDGNGNEDTTTREQIDNTTEESNGIGKNENGCGSCNSSVSAASFSLVSMIGAGVFVFTKKKRDD